MVAPMSKLARISLILLILLLLCVGATFLFLNQLAAKAVEKGGTYALGVPTTLSSARIHPVDGKFALLGMHVANPEGFSSPHFFELQVGELQVAMSSLTKDTVEAPQLELNGLDLNLERASGKTNYGAILDHLKRFESEGPPKDDSGGKKFIVRDVLIRDITVHVDLVPVGGSLTKTTVSVPEIHLTNVGTGEDAKSISQLMSEILTAVLNAAVQSAGDLIPAEVLGDLKGGLSGLKGVALDLGKGIQGVGKEVGEKAGDLLKGVIKKL
jgi:hypothetical protein